MQILVDIILETHLQKLFSRKRDYLFTLICITYSLFWYTTCCCSSNQVYSSTSSISIVEHPGIPHLTGQKNFAFLKSVLLKTVLLKTALPSV